MRSKRLLTGLVILIIVAASFVVLDFGISRSDSQLESYPLEFLLGTPLVKPSLLIYVEDGAISNELRERLTQDFGKIFTDVKPVKEPLEKFDDQVLIVEYTWADLFYTPFYSKAHVELNMTFSSNGDVSWRYRSSITANKSLDVAWYKVRMVLDDQTYGIVSLKHYNNYLAQRFADNMKGKIEKIFDYLHIKFKNQSLTVEPFMSNVLLWWEIVRRTRF